MKYLIFLTILLASCGKTSITVTKYTCTCEQLEHVENFVTQNIAAKEDLTPATVAQIRVAGVMLICRPREFECDEDGNVFWGLWANRLDSCEIFQF